MIANFAAMDVRPGSMGRPAARRRGRHRAPGRTTTASRSIEEPDVQGELALRPGWPSMFRGYWDEPERYRKCFVGGWYLTGDLARRDADGYFWFVGRADDVIKTSGHLIGPFEVESVLMEHPAVAEAGVIGKPDPVAMEMVKAFVVAQGTASQPTPELRRELLAHARHAPRRRGGAQGDRLSRVAAQDAQRQDHAPAAEGPRAGAARGRHVHARGGLGATCRTRDRASMRSTCCARCC